jgi:hypothetical protein
VRAVEHAAEDTPELRSRLPVPSRDQRVESDGTVRREDVTEDPGGASPEPPAPPRLGVREEEELVNVASEHVAARFLAQHGHRTEPARASEGTGGVKSDRGNSTVGEEFDGVADR